LLPPASLCEDGEILTPADFYALVEDLRQVMAECNALVILNSPNYEGSYFTQAELLQWRLLQDAPEAWVAEIATDGGVEVTHRVPLEPTTSEQKKSWEDTFTQVRRRKQNPKSNQFQWGQIAKTCFVVGCRNCGDLFLATRKAIEKAVEGSFRLACPHCDAANFKVTRLAKQGRFHRDPTVVEQAGDARMRVIEWWEMLHLLMGDSGLASVPMVRAGFFDTSVKGDRDKIQDWIAIGGVAISAGLLLTQFLQGGEEEDRAKG
jgi:hypothetical protein